MTKPFKHIINGMQVKGNCFACEHLEYVDDQSYEIQDGGFCCNKREYKTERQERDHLNLLNYEDQRYLKTAKKCCEIRKDWLKG
jgi:hypothetical protein